MEEEEIGDLVEFADRLQGIADHISGRLVDAFQDMIDGEQQLSVEDVDVLDRLQ